MVGREREQKHKLQKVVYLIAAWGRDLNRWILLPFHFGTMSWEHLLILFQRFDCGDDE